MNGILSNSALALVYSSVLLFGLALIGGAIVSLLRSFTPGRQSRPRGSPHPVFSRAALYSLGLGAAVFGGAGLILLAWRVAPVSGVLVALGSGLVASFAALALLVYLPARGRVEEALIDFDAAGRRARVVIPIPANGLGEVALVDDGGEPIHLGARAATGAAIDAGATVVVDRVTKRIAVVRPLP